MNRIYIFIILCIAGIIGTSVSMVFSLHWSCMIGTIIFVVAVALTLDVYFKERREKDEKMYNEILSRERAIVQFKREFNLDQPRAERLYKSGFKAIEDFQDKTVEELMQIEDINPTMAKRIVQRMQDINLS